MEKELELKLQEEFPFMKQNHVPEEKNSYKKWGCQCDSGWFDIIYDCCRQITERYAQDGVQIDFQPEQIREKFGTLRFDYMYTDASGENITEEAKKALREDIAVIVRAAEKRSETTCELCGDTSAAIRAGLGRAVTLCEPCISKYITLRENEQKEMNDKAKKLYEEIVKNKKG